MYLFSFGTNLYLSIKAQPTRGLVTLHETRADVERAFSGRQERVKSVLAARVPGILVSAVGRRHWDMPCPNCLGPTIAAPVLEVIRARFPLLSVTPSKFAPS